MSTRAALIEDNLRVLEQCRALLARVDDALYAKPEPGVCWSAIGGQIRHVLDFYARFLADAPSGRIDYDRRERDSRVETDRGAAHARLAELAAAFAASVRALGRGALWVRQDAGAEGSSSWAASTVERELQALLSHTVHHQALVAVILRLNGADTPAEFGVARSTLRHWEAVRASTPCAP